MLNICYMTWKSFFNSLEKYDKDNPNISIDIYSDRYISDLEVKNNNYDIYILDSLNCDDKALEMLDYIICKASALVKKRVVGVYIKKENIRIVSALKGKSDYKNNLKINEKQFDEVYLFNTVILSHVQKIKEDEKIKNKKQKKLYRLLGAEHFQKVVFKVETIKYKIIDRYFPNIIEKYEKNLNKRFKSKIKNISDKEKATLLAIYQRQKLLLRKELVYKQNRNYHYSNNTPTQFIKYLELNKKIHIKGLKRGIGVLILINIMFILGIKTPVLYIFSSLNLLNILKDFECINLQNYNLCRFQNEKVYNCLKQIEIEIQKKNLKELGESTVKTISKAVNSQIELPTIEQIVDSIETKEEANNLLKYLQKQYDNLNQCENDLGKKVI